jgi:hypothetical protein
MIQKQSEKRFILALIALGEWSHSILLCEQCRTQTERMTNEIEQPQLVDCTDLRPVGRKANAAYRVREHLTESEMARLLVP